MKKILAIALFLPLGTFLMSSSCKEVAADSVSPQTDEMVEVFVTGTVTKKMNEDTCDQFLIALEDPSEKRLLLPIELEESYQKEGLQIEFRFHTSRIKQENCFNAQPVVIESIRMKE